MRKFVTLASIVVLAASAVACGQSSNSATDILSLGSPVSPSALEARTGAGGGGKGGGKGSGGTTTGGGGGTISQPVMLVDTGTAGTSFGDTITFSVSTSATSYPWVTVKCVKGGVEVYKTSNGIFQTSLDQDFTLGPTPAWQSGGADCTATLENWDNYTKGSITVLATTSFTAAG